MVPAQRESGPPSRKLPLVLAVLTCCGAAIAQSSEYFTIRVVDDRTGRGVPLVELRTTNDVPYYTDSNGIVAFYEPGLMGETVYFHVKTDGYELPEDSFGNRGVALRVTSGGRAEVRIKRTIIAERLYRITGEGIYRDSVLVGAPVPIKQPVLNGRVMGQDGGLAIPYRGKLLWIWGDTAQPSYPLGNFGCSGATSEWPSNGGLDPNVGVDLSYFVDDSGFSRAMFPSTNFPGPGPKWAGGLKIVRDERGNERLVADYVRIKNLGEAYERGEAIYDDKTGTFQRIRQFDLNDAMASICWGGHPVPVNAGGISYYYQNYIPPFLCRMKSDLAQVQDPTSYEGFSPLVAGGRYAGAGTKLDRTAAGNLQYGWKRNTPPLSPSQEEQLITAGKMKPGERLFQLQDVDTGSAVKPGPGSIQWNSFRQRWVMIVKEDEGLANHSILWFAEADTPLGPWVYAKRILRHDSYNFYNPVQHAFFDGGGGRVIFFEGTYSELFAAGASRTPRYNYNQIMYRLDLTDPRLALPVPVYNLRRDGAGYMLHDELEAENAWDSIESAPFFAIPPRYRHDGLIPIFAVAAGHGTGLRLLPSAQATGTAPLFYALPIAGQTPPPPQGLSGKWSCTAKMADNSDHTSLTLDLRLEGGVLSATSDAGDVQGDFQDGQLRLELKSEDGSYALTAELKEGKLKGTWLSRSNAGEHGALNCERASMVRPLESAAVVPLYEYVNVTDGSRLYSTDSGLLDKMWRRTPQPLCRVWRNPFNQLILDPTARPVPVRPPQFISSRRE